MGLKDKAKSFWKRVSDLEDNRDTSTSPANEEDRIPYKDISKKLKDLMKENVDVVGRKIIIPNYYAVYFNAADRKKRAEVEDVLCDELKEELSHEMRKINPEQNKRDLLIEIKTDPALEAGQFRIEHHIKKPVAEEKTIENFAAVPPQVENEMDYQQTVIEQAPCQSADDEKTVVMPRTDAAVLYRLLIASGEEKREINITKKTISIGRGSKDDINLPSPDFSISRAHALLDFKDGSFYLTPSGINGTLVNGQELAINKEIKIAAGDEIKIMNYSLKIIK